MSDIQFNIDKMHDGSIETIMQGISSDTPIELLNSIIAGTKLRIKEKSFVDGVEKATKSEVALMGIPLKEFAVASLEILGIRRYLGENERIKAMIQCEFNF